MHIGNLELRQRYGNWELYDGRLSRTVLREAWGEVPLAYSLSNYIWKSKKISWQFTIYIREIKRNSSDYKYEKTKIDTAYHGVPFLGKVSYPYGYQKPSKQVIIRTYQKAKKIKFTDEENLLAKTNSQIGSLKNYNCKKLIIGYGKALTNDIKKILSFDMKECKFKIENKKTE